MFEILFILVSSRQQSEMSQKSKKKNRGSKGKAPTSHAAGARAAGGATEVLGAHPQTGLGGLGGALLLPALGVPASITQGWVMLGAFPGLCRSRARFWQGRGRAYSGWKGAGSSGEQGGDLTPPASWALLPPRSRPNESFPGTKGDASEPLVRSSTLLPLPQIFGVMRPGRGKPSWAVSPHVCFKIASSRVWPDTATADPCIPFSPWPQIPTSASAIPPRAFGRNEPKSVAGTGATAVLPLESKPVLCEGAVWSCC